MWKERKNKQTKNIHTHNTITRAVIMLFKQMLYGY